MRRILFGLVFIVLFVIACSPREDTIKESPAVRLFTAINGEVDYAEKVFSGSDAKAFADLVKTECPQGVGDEFVRVTLDAESATFVLYTSKDGKNVTCSVLKPKGERQVVVKSQADAPDEETAFTVNGGVITLTQLRAAIDALPQNVPRDTNAIALAANQLINDELLRQEATKMDVSADDIAAARASVLSQANLTEETLPARLSERGVTMEDFNSQILTQAKLQALLDTRLLLREISVTDADAQSYYMANPTEFLRSEQAVMRHIFVSNNRSQGQFSTITQTVLAQLNDTDFCELVSRYSDDAQSKENCGVYVIARGVIDPNIELAGFNTPVNQTSVVNTASGVHFVQSLQVVPAQVVPYTQVAGQLQSSLRNTLMQQRLNLYLATLRARADITSYLG